MSPDTDFSQVGAASGIKYADSFAAYKEMIVKDRDSPMYQRIFQEFNTCLFGTAPTPRNDIAPDTGNYESEIEQFINELHEDTSMVLDVTDLGAPPPPLSNPPALQSDHHVSVSVTSHVSHAVATSSHMTNVINTNTAPSPEPETPPSLPKASRPRPKKKGTNPTLATASSSNTDPAGTDSIPTRTLRKRNKN